MDLLTQSESGMTTQNLSVKTKEQREIEQIIASSKFTQPQALPHIQATEYSSQQIDRLSLHAQQNSSLAKAV